MNVMLVEDHSLFRQALAVLLDGEPNLQVIAQAGSLAEARAQAAALNDPIHIAVVDLALPDGDATVLIPEVRRASPGVRVMVLTASVEPEVSTRAFEAGASAVVHKAVSRDEILATVRGLVGNG